uniref:Uncharacterized protein n=1 Tax=Fagus sylvatica TaxID=28930 RepID=A0A2N9GQ74_FAGSY
MNTRSLLSVLSSFSAEARNGLGFGLRLETPAWWLIGLAISARNGLGLRFEVGNAGVVVVAWACDLGVVVAWACRSCGSRPGFADLGLGLPSLFPPLFRRERFGGVWRFGCCLEVWFVNCDVSVRGLVVYGGLVAVWRFGL